MEDPEEEYMSEDDENGFYDHCVKCSRTYDDIDYDYQSCSKCGWDEANKKWDKPREPEDADYLNGDADILTGRWT